MFTVIGALIGLFIDIIVILCIAAGIIALPFALIGWVIGRFTK